MSNRKFASPGEVQLVDFESRYARAFRDLNAAWIEQYFSLESEDRRLLEDPQRELVEAGGYIVMALRGGEAVGTCALLPLPEDPDYEFELVKMAVSPSARGLGIGEALGRHVLAKARALGARRVYLETNPVLGSAVRLYRRLGFEEVVGHDSPFARCGLQMGTTL